MSSGSYRGPINPNPVDGEAAIVIYGYVPSLALGIVGAITFFVTLVAHSYHMIRKGKGYRSFHALLAFGSLMECGGYAARIFSSNKPFVVVAFIVQYFLIVVSPVLFTAAIYLSLNILVKGFERGEKLLVLKPKVVLAIFVTADAITTVVQVAGAALVGVSESAAARGNSSPVTPNQANNILLAGLAVQTFSFLIFLTILSIAIYRATRPTFPGEGVPSAPYKRLRSMLWVILATSDLILLRTVFRLAETAQGLFSFASTHEYLFGILEYTPVILALLIWAALPPYKLIQGKLPVVGDVERSEPNSAMKREGPITPTQG